MGDHAIGDGVSTLRKVNMKIHPAADFFPMMSEDELTDLADDIKANGQHFPIILDKDGQLIDGRNRLAACKLAGVEPRFDQLNGHDPLAYIAGVNLKRRNLTKGQQAMALAMIYPEPETGGRGKKSQRVEETSTFSTKRLQQARSVLAFSKPMAEAVLKGVDSLDAALQKVDAEKQREQGDTARLERLHRTTSDLADLVDEGRMTLNEAMAALNERMSRLRSAYQAGLSAAEQLTDFCGLVAAIREGEEARVALSAALSDFADPPIRVKPEKLKQVADAVALLQTFGGRTK